MPLQMQSPDKTSAAPVRSMTGFAMVRKDTAAGMLTVSLKTVNHRGLDLHFHAGELGRFENGMRALLKQNIARGHVEIRATLARNAGTEFGYNRDLLTRYLGLFRAAREEFDLKSEPDLNFVLALPGMFENSPEQTALDNGFEAEILDALAECIRELNTYREREGTALVAGLESEITSIEERTRQIARIRSNARELFPGALARAPAGSAARLLDSGKPFGGRSRAACGSIGHSGRIDAAGGSHARTTADDDGRRRNR